MNVESARELLGQMVKCAKRAGVYKYMFIGFGTMLGAIRGNALIPHDDDMDICFLPMIPGLRDAYYKECCKEGLLDGWENPVDRVSCTPTGELLWFSAKKTKKGAKSCNWFFLNWEDCLWHTKGAIWVSDIHFSKKLKWRRDDEGIMLGAPKDLFRGLKEIEFEGVKVNIPVMAGSLCDLYYPNWFFPKEGGSSAQDRIARVGNWGDTSTWENLL